MTNTHLLFKNHCKEHDLKATDYPHFQGNKGVEENNVRNQYSIPGILHFIQHEWARWVKSIKAFVNKVDLSTWTWFQGLRWSGLSGRSRRLNCKQGSHSCKVNIIDNFRNNPRAQKVRNLNKSRWEKRSRKPQERSGPADKDARIRPQTGISSWPYWWTWELMIFYSGAS